MHTTTTTATNSSQPTSRFQIHPLTSPLHALWSTAIIAQSHTYTSPIFSKIWTPSAVTFNKWLTHYLPLVESRMSESWPLSFGVFDNEYQYATEEARRVGGMFDWEWDDEDVKRRKVEKMTGDEVLRRMDFPLVSIVLSYDGVQKTDQKILEYFVGAFPEAGLLLGTFEKVDPRPFDEWKPEKARQILRRYATNTRTGYGGLGLVKNLTYHLINEARGEGFKAMQVEAIHAGITHILLNAPSPCHVRVIGSFEAEEVEDGNGTMIFQGVKQTMSRVWVDLNEVEYSDP